ncbi:MAG: hypothetical protein K9J74_05950 [Sulfuritalea sp.]|nr:hypothetical protein [Sulfuritalea sp.]
MNPRTVIFYVALIFIAGCISELYVRIKGIGDKAEKVRGVVKDRKPRLGAPLALLVAAIIAAAMTIPN